MKTKGSAFSHRLSDAKRAFVQTLKESGLLDECRCLARERHYATSMILDMLKRDHAELISHAGLPDSSIRKLLVEHGVIADTAQYLKLPQEVKLQFRYPVDWSLVRIREEQRTRSRRGLDSMLEKRRKWTHYQPKNHPEHWIAQGMSAAAAQHVAEHERKRKSPHSVEFVGYRELPMSERMFLISRLAAERGIRGLESMGACASSLERMMSVALTAHGVVFEQQKVIGCSRELRARLPDANAVYVFDFYLPEKRTLIECNGTYWHADPRVYEPHETLQHPGCEISAAQIWAADALKSQIVREYGYEIKTVWELDMVKPGFVQSFVEEVVCA